MKHVLAAVSLLLALLPALRAAPPPAGPVGKKADGTLPPNIVVILSDDHSAPFVGCYGYPVKTPNLDRFAAQGLRFERAFTASPQCVPSRASYMTGRSPQAARVGRFINPVPRDVPILPELLRLEAGYFSGVCRRIHHLDGAGAGVNDLNREIFQRHRMVTMPDRLDYVDISGPGNTPARVNEFLDKVPAGRPFFLWVNFNDPHHPWDAPKVHDPATLPLPADWPDLPELRADLGRYLDEVARMDGEFQSVLEILAQRGLDKNTVVIFAGDNGAALPHGKGSLHERGLHVPFIVRWPGVVAPGTTTSALFSGEDLTPTLLEVAGLKARAPMTGVSHLPVLRGGKVAPRQFVFGMREPHASVVFNETTNANGYDLGRSVRDDRYKLIVNYTPAMAYAPVDSAGDPGWRAMRAAHTAAQLGADFEKLYFTTPRPILELYDLQADPFELKNLAGQKEHAAAERRLKVALHEKMVVDYDYLPQPVR
jgi:N-sulfoglucosamine sulfohydrolase